MKKTNTKCGSKKNEESLTSYVYNTFIERLLHNKILPGTLVDRQKLAAELGVSIAPVRDALIRLAFDGYVESFPRRGTIVKSINRDDVYGSAVLREAVECQAARIYCKILCSVDKTPFIEAAQRVDHAFSETSDNFVLRWNYDVDFHTMLVTLSGCSALVELFKKIMRAGAFYQINTFLLQSDRQEKLSHTELLHNLCTDDPDKAEKIIRTHLKSGKYNFYKMAR